MGITNQRETIIAWNRNTGIPYHNAILWQDTRTRSQCDELEKDGYGKIVREKTGLSLNTYFSTTKIKWMLDHIDKFRNDALKGEAVVGTVDSWII